MPKVSDVNTTDIVDAIRLGCRMMCNVFNAEDDDIPYFRVIARPEAFLGMSMEDHIPGRHLNGLLNAEDAVGIQVDEDCIEKHAKAAFYSYSGSLPLPLGRDEGKGSPVRFSPHNVREGFHALYPLVQYRNCDRARKIAEASIETIFKNWEPVNEWNVEVMQRDHGIVWPEKIGYFISGLARCIGPLVKYYRATGYGPALELAVMLKEKAISECFLEDGSYDAKRFGDHVHSTTCVMSSLAQLADLTRDSHLMNRVKVFYANGLWEMRDELGWSIESTNPQRQVDEGEMNNTGDILETALILGHWGYTDYYHDAERILRCHLLPSQLRDVSFIRDPDNPEGSDGKRNVADRVRGAYGFPAPYGHEPVGNQRIRFNTDVVGGSVGSLCEAYRDATRFDQAGHWVNLLFDHETPHIHVESPYTHPALRIRLKRPGALFVRIPPWVDHEAMRVNGVTGDTRHSNGYLFCAAPPVNRPISIGFPLIEQKLTLVHRHTGTQIRTRLRGDAVVDMENFGADLTFFDPLA